jgi:hypothetical protein
MFSVADYPNNVSTIWVGETWLMKMFKSTVLGAALASVAVISAYAADPSPATQTQAYPPQVATNPGLPYSPTRVPGPKAGPSGWIPSPNSQAPAVAPNSDTGSEGSYYSGKGFGPKAH